MKQMLSVFAIVLMIVILASACGPTTPAPAQPTQVVEQVMKIEATPTVAQIMPTTPAPAKAAAPSGCPPPAGWSAYTIQRGDTLYALAKQVKQTPDEVMRANCLTSSTISVGATLYLPLESCIITPPEGWLLYSVRGGDTLSSLATVRNTTVAEVKRVNCLVSDSLDVGKQLYLPPAPPAPPAPVAPAPAAQPQAPAPEPGGGGEAALPSEVFSTGIQEPVPPPFCTVTPTGALPAIVTTKLLSSFNRLVLCLYGFPKDKDMDVFFSSNDVVFGYDTLTITLDGNIVSVRSGGIAGRVTPGTTNLELFPWWPVDLPETVSVQVNSAGKPTTQIIRNTDLGRHVGFSRPVPYEPFPKNTNIFTEPDCLEVNASAGLQFLGTGFTQGQRIPIGLYVQQGVITYTLSAPASGQAMTDSEGRFQFPVAATPGTSYAVADPITTTLEANPWRDCYTSP